MENELSLAEIIHQQEDEIVFLREKVRSMENLVATLRMELATIHYERCVDSAKSVA